MASEILSIGTAAANSSDITLAEGESATLSLKDNSGPEMRRGGIVVIQIKDDAGLYFDFQTLSVNNSPLVLDAVGTFRVRRVDTGVPVGVFRG